jgi:peptidoglycan/LPS O-acetylase OafA/YrhL
LYPTNRNKNLDFLRGLAVLLVISGHFIPGYMTNYLGWSGVDLFFVLSGFFVSGILIGEYRKNGSIKPLRFFLRRGFKIWPLFYTALFIHLIYYFIKGNPPGTDKVLNEFFFLQNYFHGFLNVTWSLGVEEQFYLLLALGFFFLPKGKSLHQLPYFCLMVMVLCLIFRVTYYFALNSNYDPYAHFFPLYMRADSLCAGILIAYYFQVEPIKFENWVIRNRLLLLAMAFGLSIPLFIYPYFDRATFTFGFTTTYSFYAILVMLFLFPGKKVPVFSKLLYFLVTGIAWVGFYSYSIYLFHYSVGFGVLANLKHLFGYELPVPLEFGLVLVSCLLVGYIFSRLIEFPFLRLRERLYPPEGKGS